MAHAYGGVQPGQKVLIGIGRGYDPGVADAIAGALHQWHLTANACDVFEFSLSNFLLAREDPARAAHAEFRRRTGCTPVTTPS